MVLHSAWRKAGLEFCAQGRVAIDLLDTSEAGVEKQEFGGVVDACTMMYIPPIDSRWQHFKSAPIHSNNVYTRWIYAKSIFLSVDRPLTPIA